MNKFEKEVLQSQFDKEKAVLEQIKKTWDRSLNDINQKTKLLMFDIQQLDEALNANGLDDRSKEVLESQKRAKIYQKQQQDALQKQVAAITEKLHSDEYSTIEQYLKECYTDAYVGTMYDIAGQGIPIITPIDQVAVVRAVTLDSKISEGLYKALGVDTKALKTAISAEISRGIATGQSYAQIAKNLNNVAQTKYGNAVRIVRTEGHRIQQQSAFDAQQSAKKKGCDVLKQWDAALDGRTRDTHRALDGQIREVDEPFKANGKSAMYPGAFGDPAEDCNCRCTSNTRARWALDDDELQTLKDRAKYFELDKTKDFDDFKKKYLKAEKAIENSRKSSTIDSGAKGALTSKNDPQFKKRKAHAKQYYESIRNSDGQSIIASVSKNSGIAVDDVTKAINHLFYEKHDLEKGHTYFEEDYDIAESIRRLREGTNIQAHDLILIRHEAMESDYMESGMTFEEAHAKTEEQYNYTFALRAFLIANGLE